MADKNRCQTFSHAERCKVGSGQDFGNGDTCPKPDQAILEQAGTFFVHFHVPLFAYIFIPETILAQKGKCGNYFPSSKINSSTFISFGIQPIYLI